MLNLEKIKHQNNMSNEIANIKTADQVWASIESFMVRDLEFQKDKPKKLELLFDDKREYGRLIQMIRDLSYRMATIQYFSDGRVVLTIGDRDTSRMESNLDGGLVPTLQFDINPVHCDFPIAIVYPGFFVDLGYDRSRGINTKHCYVGPGGAMMYSTVSGDNTDWETEYSRFSRSADEKALYEQDLETAREQIISEAGESGAIVSQGTVAEELERKAQTVAEGKRVMRFYRANEDKIILEPVEIEGINWQGNVLSD